MTAQGEPLLLQTKFTAPGEALGSLLERLQPVATEVLPWQEAPGRVLAQALVADRDSPPCDASAMDGYAVRMADLQPGGVALAGEVLIGQAPPVLPPGRAMRIFTGAPLPAGAEAVIPRENVEESPDRIVLRHGVEVTPGQHIRRQGENVKQQQVVIDPGKAASAAVMSAAATFGATRLRVYRKVRMAVIATGDELRPPESPVQPWQLRDANGPALLAMLQGQAWLQPPQLHRTADDLEAISQTLRQALAECDAVLLTGGVSAGDHDYVPAAVTAAGGETIFHRLPIRPGKPLLGAVGPGGQAILGLPGNPVSVMVTARRFAVAMLRRLAGMVPASPPPPAMTLVEPDQQTLHLWWYRPVRLLAGGRAALVPGRGSADVVAAAGSDGFVEIPPHGCGPGPWPFWPWQL